MLPARFRILERWLLRSRRFRHGPLLILLLATVGSAHAPVRFPGPFPRLTAALPTSPTNSEITKPALTAISLVSDPALIDPPAEYIWQAAQWPASPLSNYPSAIEPWPNPQPLNDSGSTGSNIEPAQPPAIDLPLAPTVIAAGFDFFRGSVSPPASNAVQPIKPVPVTPGTPVPEPGEFCFIAIAFLALRRHR